MNNLFLLMLLALFACNDQPAAGQQETKPSDTVTASTRRIEILDPEAFQFFDSTTTIDVIAGGFEWTEGPLYIAGGDYFLFSDIPRNRIYKWKEGDSVKLYLEPSGYLGTVKGKKEPGSNGLLLHTDGHLVLCQHGERRMAKMKAPISDPKPDFEVLADRFEGKRFNSPNDAVYHPNGDLYFTDPPYGLDKGRRDPAKELDFSGVFRLTPDGRVDLLTKELDFPNGIALTPDGKFLLVASSDGKNQIWMKYELDGQGLIKSKQLFYEVHRYEGKNVGGPDGMKMSRKGYLFASGPEGCWVFNPAGKPIARLYTGQATSNTALSTDEKVLFLTCDDYVMRVKMK